MLKVHHPVGDSLVVWVELVVLRGTTKDAERASKARSKHSTHSGHSMIKPVANSAAYNFWLSYNANNSPKTQAFVKRDCASETGKSEIANPSNAVYGLFGA